AQPPSPAKKIIGRANGPRPMWILQRGKSVPGFVSAMCAFFQSLAGRSGAAIPRRNTEIPFPGFISLGEQVQVSWNPLLSGFGRPKSEVLFLFASGTESRSFL